MSFFWLFPDCMTVAPCEHLACKKWVNEGVSSQGRGDGALWGSRHSPASISATDQTLVTLTLRGQTRRKIITSLGSSADHWPGSDTWTLNTSGLGPGWLLSVRFLLLKFQIQNNKLRQELTHTPRREQNPDNRTRVTLVVKKPGICKVRFHAGIWSLFQFILEIIYQILHQIKTSLHELLTFQKPRVHLHPLCSVVWLGAGKNLNKTPTQIVTT